MPSLSSRGQRCTPEAHKGAAENEIIKQLCLFQPNQISMFGVQPQRGLWLVPSFCTGTEGTRVPARPQGSVVLPVDQKATRAPQLSSRLDLFQMNKMKLKNVSRLLLFSQSGLQ